LISLCNTLQDLLRKFRTDVYLPAGSISTTRGVRVSEDVLAAPASQAFTRGLITVSIHMRTVAESEIQDDHTWLAAFMAEA
jgi:hypothetical protein